MLREPAILIWILLTAVAMGQGQERVRVEMPYEGGTVVLVADQVTREGDQFLAEGQVVVTYQDSVLKADKAIYLADTHKVQALGRVELTKGVQYLRGTRAELDVKTDTGVIYDADGYTDQELFIRAKQMEKTGPNTFRAKNAFLTACNDALPKWSFAFTNATIKVGATARMKHTLFRIKGVPVFYLPYVLFPTEKKKRSSGFMLPTTGNSSNKGRRFSQSFYLTLGDSADLMINETYFSERGFAHGFTFRTKPNAYSSLQFDAFMIDDRKDQGGASLNGLGETHFGRGFRAVADFNLVSNFLFRQVFSEDFYVATRPTENSRIFLTNNFGVSSVNVLLSREETIFPDKNVVVRTIPSLDFRIRGRQVPRTPLLFDFESSFRGLSRSDPLIQTDGTSHRFDFFPRIYSSVPLFQGLRLTPQLGLRQTFYADSLVRDEAGNVTLTRDNLFRSYAELDLSLQGWGLSRVFGDGGEGSWKHLIEPTARYRLIRGIDEFDRIIRFDEDDAVANANELEYGIFNRFFRKRQVESGLVPYEFLSVKVVQKHFFDPDFSGALREGEINQFYPLYTITGFYYGSVPRNFSPIVTQVRVSPEPGFSFDVRGDFDTRHGEFRNFSVTGFFGKPRFSFGTSYFLTQQLGEEPGTFDSNQLQAQLYVGNQALGLSGSTSFSYDAASSRFLNSLSRINYIWDCCGVSVEVQAFDLGTAQERVRQERQIRFSFFLKGIGAFGTIKRPPNVF